jgi:hypothetical protein
MKEKAIQLALIRERPAAFLAGLFIFIHYPGASWIKPPTMNLIG